MRKLILIAALCLTMTTAAQKVERKGNNFVQVKSVSAGKDSLTIYTYEVSGKKYPIHLSKNGKAFIIRVSKKTGKEYKQYLPQVTEQLNKK